MVHEFERRFGPARDLRVFRAPGRVNLIGEHTDYNLGFVLPIALQLETRVASAPASHGRLRAFSEERQELREWDIGRLVELKPSGDWGDYIAGVARELAIAGVTPRAQNLLIRSTVPDGAGLSSSAALEVSTALALLADRPFDRLALARLCQRAEVEFVGMPSGIMDQYISIFGEAGAALCIDCRSLESRTVLLPRSTAIVAVNSMVKHELSQSAYRTRTEECARAVDRLRARFPAIRSLREVAPGQLPEAETLLPEPLRRRARHVISENSRVEKFVEAAGRSDLAAMGRLFVESHRSLQHDYEVSCLELDFLVDSALTIEGVQGARMTGGGFGGCTVNLVSPELQGRFQERIQQLYQRRFGITPLVYLCQPSAGAGESGT